MIKELVEALREFDISSRYKPAYLSVGKEWRVVYYVVHPATGRWVRKREKLGHIRDERTRRRFGDQRVRELNLMLSLGWNPFTENNQVTREVALLSSLDEFLSVKMRETDRKDTHRTYRSGVTILQEWVVTQGMARSTVKAMGEREARAFMLACQQERDLSARTFNNYLTFYTTVWNWFIERDYCQTNVFKAVKRKKVLPDSKRSRPPTSEERQLIRAHLEKENPRFLTFCLLCFHCAIRPKEIFHLKPEHFNIKDQVVTIPGKVAKNRATRGVAIPNVLVPHLLQLRLDRQPPEHFVFSTGFQSGHKLKDSRHSGRTWDTMRKAIGLDPAVTLYELKHAGGEQLSRDGVSEVDLMNHFRHHDLSETSTYTRRSYTAGVRDVVKKASKF